MYWNIVAIDGVIKNQLDNTQQDATLEGKKKVKNITFSPEQAVEAYGVVRQSAYRWPLFTPRKVFWYLFLL
jgi:hypothetical protein